MMRPRVIALLLILCLAGCAGIKGQQVTMEDLDQTAVQVHQSHLSDIEKQQFDEAKARADNGEYDVTNKTVGQMIADQAAYDADQKAQAEKQAHLAAEERARHNAQVAALKNAVTVALVDKGYQPADYMNGQYESYLTVQLALKNNAHKTIRSVKGTLDFETPMGDSIYQTNFEDNDTIASGTTADWNGSIQYNEFNDSQNRFKDTDLNNIKLNWEPAKILFTDGSHLEVTQ